MKRRLLSLLLALAMLFGAIPTALSFASAEESVAELVIEQWNGSTLDTAKQSGQSYTTETIGVREPASASRGDWYWLMHVRPTSVRPDGSKIFTAGTAVKVVARYNTDSTYTGGNFDAIDATNCGGPMAYITKELFDASPIKTDDVFGYSYREVTVDMGVLESDISQMNMHIGLPTTAGRHTVELYGLSVYADGELVWDCEGDTLARTTKGNIVREDIANTTGSATGIFLPHSETPSDTPISLVELVSQAIPAGRYALDINLKTYGNYGIDSKMKVTISSPSGVLQTKTYTKEDVLAHLLSETVDRYDTLRLDFELPAADANQSVTVKVEAFNGTDLYLRDVTLKEYTTQKRVDALEVIRDIEEIGQLTQENFLEKLEAIEKAEASYAAYVAAYDEQTAEDCITNAADLKKAREDYDAFVKENEEYALKQQAALSLEKTIDAIPAFGPYSYRTARTAIEQAEAELAALTEQYGADAAELVTNLSALKEARARLDYLLGYLSDRFKETEMTKWKGSDMTPASDLVVPYTTEVIGVREPASDQRGDWYWLMFLTPPSTYSDGSPIFTQDSELQVVMRVSNSDSSYDGSGYFEFIDTHGTDGALSHYITREEYEEAPEETDPTFGYTYKELTLSMGIMSKDYTDLRFHIGVNNLGGRHTVEIYYFGVCVDGELVWECEGDVLSNAGMGNVVRENIENETGEVTGLYAAATEEHTLTPMADGITAKLEAGVYAYDIELMTVGNNGLDNKVRFTATAPDGTVLSSYDYAKVDVVESLHVENTRRYDTTRFYVTVDETYAGQDITLRVETYGSSEVYLRSVQLLSLVSSKQADAERVEKAINDIGEITEENYLTKKELITSAQNMLASFVESYGQNTTDELIGNLAALQKAKEDYERLEAEAIGKQKQTDAQELIAAIDAIGEVTQENYADRLSSIEAVEQMRYTFVSNYGEESLTLITNDNKLMEARNKYNSFKDAEPDVVYGDLNGDGQKDASDALLALQHSVKLTELKDDAFTAADVDGNETVDASDALYILQYSVKLIEKFPVEK